MSHYPTRPWYDQIWNMLAVFGILDWCNPTSLSQLDSIQNGAKPDSLPKMCLKIIVFSRWATPRQLEQPPSSIICFTRKPQSCYATWCHVDHVPRLRRSVRSHDLTSSERPKVKPCQPCKTISFLPSSVILWNSLIPARSPSIEWRASFSREIIFWVLLCQQLLKWYICLCC